MKTASSEFTNIPINSGFTILELIIGIAILGLTFTIGTAKYLEFNKTQTLKSAVLEMKNNLRDIQAKANAGVKPSGSSGCTGDLVGYVVHYSSTTQYQVYADCGNPSITRKTYSLIATTKFQPMFADFTFLSLSEGVSPAARTINIESTSISKFYAINISRSGEITESEITP
jgi:prepilin-type N-terminal cleavage/methylation domain-containing protein